MKKLYALGVMSIMLAGCQTTGTTTSLAPVCKALGPPHEYNSRTTEKAKNSSIHAGPVLAQRLRRDNYVGRNLPCPGY